MADPRWLRQLFENLFRNAVEHAGPDVNAKVGALTSGEGFFIEDDGPGLDDADPDRFFEYGRSVGGGTGLGLAIVKDIVDAHGWWIRVADSNAGVRFEISTAAADGGAGNEKPVEGG